MISPKLFKTISEDLPLMVYPHVLSACVKASEAVMEVYRKGASQIDQKEDGSLVTEADKRSSEIIFDCLAPFPARVIDEEQTIAPYSKRQKSLAIWLVDPLDGTHGFVHRDMDFAVNIALIYDERPIFGAIAMPTHKMIVFGGVGFGTFFCYFSDITTEKRWRQFRKKTDPISDTRLVFLSSHTPQELQQHAIIQQLSRQRNASYRQQRSALKFMTLALQEADIYPRFAPSMEWDVAAGHAILEGIGGQVLDTETLQPLTYNKESLFNPNFIAVHPSFLHLLSDIER